LPPDDAAYSIEETRMTTQQTTKNDPVDLPQPGPGKQDPKELDKQLDRALEASMDASDPPATIMPEVHERDSATDYEKEKRERQRKSS